MSEDATRAIPGKLVDGVFRKALGPDLTPALLEALAEVGVDLSVPLRPAYPRPTWYRAIEVTAAALYAHETPDAQLRLLGQHVMRALKDRDLIKGPWLSMARLMGPRRALKQAADFAQGGPIKLTLVEKGKHEVEIHVEEGAQPEFLAGLLEGTIFLLGGKEPSAAIGARTAVSTTFLTRWR
ncbi:MAG: DUF2378 family protein [Myxococcales bacterium]|nr:DUF2378 family protein [Myxococcales bacterium]